MALGENRMQAKASRRHKDGKPVMPRLSGLLTRLPVVILLVVALAVPFWLLACKHDSVCTTTFIKPDGHVLLLDEVGGTRGLYDAPFCPKCKAIREAEIAQVLREALDTLSVNIVLDESSEEDEQE